MYKWLNYSIAHWGTNKFLSQNEADIIFKAYLHVQYLFSIGLLKVGSIRTEWLRPRYSRKELNAEFYLIWIWVEHQFPTALSMAISVTIAITQYGRAKRICFIHILKWVLLFTSKINAKKSFEDYISLNFKYHFKFVMFKRRIHL